MTEILWPLVALVWVVLVWEGWCRYLKRDTTSVHELKTELGMVKAELAATQDDWSKRFEKYERGHDQLVTRVNNIAPSPNPLGKHYSTKHAG